MMRRLAISAIPLLAACDIEFAEPPPRSTPWLDIHVDITDSTRLGVVLYAALSVGRSRSGPTGVVIDPQLGIGSLKLQPHSVSSDILRYATRADDEHATALIASLSTGDVTLPVVEGFATPRVDAALPVSLGHPYFEWLPGDAVALHTRWMQPRQVTWQSGNLWMLLGATPVIVTPPQPLPATLLVTAVPCAALPARARLFADQHAPLSRSRDGYRATVRTTLTLHWTIPRACP
jgi:hypothetical protein